MDYSRISPLPQGLRAEANIRAVAPQQKEGMVWGQVPFTLKLSPSLGLLLFLHHTTSYCKFPLPRRTLGSPDCTMTLDHHPLLPQFPPELRALPEVSVSCRSVNLWSTYLPQPLAITGQGLGTED